VATSPPPPFPLSQVQFTQVIDLLAPAEAARHMPHPNLWSWRHLHADATADDTYLAFFVAATHDPAVDFDDLQFRRQIEGSGSI
jgi:hypothetical protein